MRANVREGISCLFEARILVAIPDPNLDLAAMLWTPAALHFYDTRHDPYSDHASFCHGIIEEASYVQPHGDEHLYALVLRPWLHGLMARTRTRIFQELSYVDICRQVLSDAGADEATFDWQVDASLYPVRPYVTQWREPTAQFFCRLLEEVGIRFWFEHSDVEHRMVLSDSSEYSPIPGDPNLSFLNDAADGEQREYVTEATLTLQQSPSLWGARDWNFETPDSPRDARFGDGGVERYEYPGGYADEGEGALLAERRIHAISCTRDILRARTTCRRMVPGQTFTLWDCIPEDMAGEYLITRSTRVFAASNAGDDDAAFEARLEAIPASKFYFPPRTIPKPVAYGKESAVVTGPAGEEIHVDRFGRVKVQFYWDREGSVDDRSSCWIRVQQQNTARQMMLPRIGWELEVGFIGGDPDRPLALQKLYNAETMPPYALPDNLMQSSLQSASTPGGGGTNEVRLNDASGGQEFFVHAQKNYSLKVGGDATEDILVDSAVEVTVDKRATVGGAEAIDIGGDQSFSVTGGITCEVAGAEQVTIAALDDWGTGANHSITVDGSRTDTIGALLNVLSERVAENFGANHTLKVGGAVAITAGTNIVESVAGSKTETIAGAKMEVVTGAKAENIGAAKALTSGALEIKSGKDVAINALGIAMQSGGATELDGGDAVTISSEDKITVTIGTLKLKAGGSRLTANASSVKVKGSSFGSSGREIQISGTVKYR